MLTGVGTALLTRALTGSLAAAVLAGVVAAFNEYRLVWEVAHLQTLSIYWFPFVLYGVERYLTTGGAARWCSPRLSWIALSLSSVYYLAYCAPFIVCFVLVEVVRHGRSRDARTWRDLAVAGVGVAVVTLPFLLPYVAMQQRMGFARTPLEVVTHSATLDNYRVALPRLIVPIALSLAALLFVAVRAIARRGRNARDGAAPAAGAGLVLRARRLHGRGGVALARARSCRREASPRICRRCIPCSRRCLATAACACRRGSPRSSWCSWGCWPVWVWTPWHGAGRSAPRWRQSPSQCSCGRDDSSAFRSISRCRRLASEPHLPT